MLAGFLLEELPRRRNTGCEPGSDSLLRGLERVVGCGILCEVEPDVRQDVDCRIEEHSPLDALGLTGAELEDEPRAEAVAEPGRAPNACRVHRLDHVREVRAQVPWRFPA